MPKQEPEDLVSWLDELLYTAACAVGKGLTLIWACGFCGYAYVRWVA